MPECGLYLFYIENMVQHFQQDKSEPDSGQNIVERFHIGVQLDMKFYNLNSGIKHIAKTPDDRQRSID